MKKFKKYNYHNHIIIIANKSVILSENIKSFPSDEFPFNKVSVIHIENLIDLNF